MAITNQNNFAAGLLYVVLGIAVAIGSSRYPMGTPARMGSGFFPFGLGLALAFTGICVVIGSFAPGAQRRKLEGWPLRALGVILLSVVLFGTLIEPMGLAVAGAVLIGVASLAHPEASWRMVLLSIVVLVPSTWVLFVLVLGLQFPMLPYFMR